jgi:ribosome-associated toxin RatA of RatAB toxin-antitoxin module
MADKTASSIMIGAPRTVVMTVIADFANYPEWASGIRRSEVLTRGSDGRAATVRFSLDAGIIKDTYVLSYEWDDDTSVRWDLAQGGSMLMEMAGGYQLADRSDGTEVAYELAVGTRVPMIGMVRRRAEKAIIDTALKGLRTRAESIGRGR